MEIQKIGDLATRHGIKAILHGGPGTGKTYSISTIPDPESVLVLSAESGLLTLKDISADIDAVQITSVEQLREAYEFLASDDGDKYKTVVLDSLTEIAQQILSSEMEASKDGRKAYGEMHNKMIKLTKSFRDLSGKNVILICQQEKMQDENGAIFHGPSMPGKQVTKDLPYLVDIIACLRVKKDEEGNTKRAFQCGLTDELILAKERGNKLDLFEQPDWSVIFNKVNGEN